MRRDEDVARELSAERLFEVGAVGDDETITVAVHAEAADELIRGGLRDREAVGIDLGECATGGEAFEAFGEIPVLGSAYAEFAHELLEACCAFGLTADVAEDFGIGDRAHELSGTPVAIRFRIRLPIDSGIVAPALSQKTR